MSIQNEESKVFSSSQELHVFANEDGSVTVRQICWPDDDSIVVIPVEHIEQVVNALRKAKRVAKG